MKSYLKLLSFIGFLWLMACGSKIEILNEPAPIIDIEQAQKIMQQQDNWVLFEISQSSKYAAQHIENAFHLWRNDYSNLIDFEYGGMRASKKQLEQLLSKYAVDHQTKILLYDTKGNVDAARFAWQLELFGFNNFYLMDGGKKAWQMAKKPLTNKIPALPKPTQFKFQQAIENQSLLADQKEVWRGIQDTQTLIIDTREIYEYQGTPFQKAGQIFPYKKGAFKNGAIPTAIHYNWSNTVNLAFDHTMKSLADIKFDLAKIGVKPEKKIIIYCQSGVRSAHTSFVLRHLLHYPNVENYDGSWIEWTYQNVNGSQTSPTQINATDEQLQAFQDK